LEHLSAEQGRLGVAEIARVLKPEGWFIGTVPYQEDFAGNQAVCPKCGEVFHRWGHQRVFDLATVRAELAPHFYKLEIERTAFIALRGRSLSGKISGAMRWLLARRGVAVAMPSIYFAGKKRSGI
jgi:SAM-dependent methyltransferase